MAILKMTDLDLAGKRVLIREDFNVPLQDGVISDDTRIRASLPGIKYALSKGARLLLVSHLGRPTEGQFDEKESLAPVAKRLSELLGSEVPLKRDWLDGVSVEPGKAVLLENCRFNKGEKKNDDGLARKMAALCDIYVNDAFATAHRAEATTHGIAKYAPVACAGPLLSASWKRSAKRCRRRNGRWWRSSVAPRFPPSSPFSRSSRAKWISSSWAAGSPTPSCWPPECRSASRSRSPTWWPKRRKSWRRSKHRAVTFPCRSDVVVAKELSATAAATTKEASQIAADDLILDIGPKTAARLSELLKQAGTIVWNGPLGVFEHDQFAAGTRAIAQAIASSPAFSLAGGGETVAALAKFGVTDKIGYVSTAGGAFLEFLEGKKLPAVEILEQRGAGKAV